MKKKLINILTIMMLLATTGCDGGNSSQTSSSQASSSSSSSEEVVADLTEQDLTKGKTTYTKADGTTADLNTDTLYRNANNPHLNPTAQGGQHVFVAPFAFKSGTSDIDSKAYEATSELRDKIVTTFTASDEEMAQKSDGACYSVESFYKHSSYGIAKFECDVMPWITYDGTASEFITACGSSSAGVTAAEYCRTWYLSEYAKDSHGALGVDAKPFSYYDADNDGFMDLVWVVYAYPYSTTDTSFWWAYVTYTSNNANYETPNVKTLGWASTNFMNKSNGYDSHTFIHETGHTFGLDDYYDYNSKWKPMGGVDYMDQNLGDHSAFSKFSLGWCNPYILKESDLEGDKTAVITLNAFTNSGDALVLASPNYNGSAFDEYLIVELVGPTGIAEYDYKNGYENTAGFTKPGVRILHVDARTYNGKSSDKNAHDTYIQDIDQVGQTATDWRVDNSYMGRGYDESSTDYFPYTDSSGQEQKGYYSLVSLIQSDGNKTDNWMLSSTYSATNSVLFRKNSTFTMKKEGFNQFFPSHSNLWNKAKTITNNGKSYTIDESMTCNYKMKVLSIDEDPTYGYTCKLQFTLDK